MSAPAGGLGLDKLQFYFPAEDVSFTPDFECSVQRPHFNSATGEVGREMELIRVTRERSISGSKAFLNTDNYQFTVKPDWQTGTPICTLAFSAGAFADTNLHPLDKDGAAEAALAVQRDLKARGAAVDLERVMMTRLDVAQNVALDEPVDAYAPLFAAAGGRKRVSKADFGGTGFLLHNTQWELSLYDKRKQMLEKGFDVSLCPENPLRAELRLMKSRVIRDRLGLTASTLPELRENWSALSPALDKALRSQLFRNSAQTYKPSVLDYDRCALVAQDGPTGRKWERFKSLLATGGLITDLGLPGAKNFTARHFAPGDTPADVRRRQRYAAELDEVAFRLALDGKPPASGRSLLTLYRELEQKLLAN